MTKQHFCSRASCLQALCAALLLLPAVLQAQIFHIRTYTEQDGLPTYAVMGVTQDGSGRMWFATVEGMVSYDGTDWTTHGSEQGLWRKGLRCAEAAADGGIWAVDMRSPIALSHFDGESWSRISAPDLDSRDWWDVVGMAAGAGPDGRERVAVATAQGRVCFWDGDAWVTAGPDARLARATCAVFHDGRVYLATPAGLFGVDPVDGTIAPPDTDGLPAGPVLGVAPVREGGGLWVVGWDWVGRCRDGRCELLCADEDLEFVAAVHGFTVLEDQLGGLYFGDAAALYYYREGCPVEVLDRESGLSSGGVTDMLLDREGNIWITSARGVSKIISRRFAGYTHLHGLFRDEVSSVHQRASGEIVLGHSAGLTFMGEEPRVLAFDSSPGRASRVIDIAEDASGTLWLACNRFGLGRLEADESITWFKEAEGLLGSVYAIQFDRTGRMWVGSMRGLFRREGDRFLTVDLPAAKGYDEPPVRRLYEGPDGALYVATMGGGVNRLTGDGITTWRDPSDMGGNGTYGVHVFPDGRIWVATWRGLYIVQGDSLTRSTAPGPEVDRPIYSIMEDDRGRIWFGTDAGVLRWDWRRLEHFTVQHGLYGLETNRDALIQADDGDVWVGTDSGVWVYREAFDLPSLSAPLLSLTGIEVDGRAHTATADLMLSAPASHLLFRFQGVSFVDESCLRFRTRLEGFQPGFEPARRISERVVRYTNVPPGAYRFHVQAIGADGNESPVATTGTIKIRQVVWLRWWALVLYGLALLAALWIVFSYYAKWRYARDLEQEVKSRTLALQDSERAVRVESRKLEAALVSISDGVVALGRDARILLANPAAEVILGAESGRLVGRTLSSVLEGDFSVVDEPAPGAEPIAVVSADALTTLAAAEPRVFRQRRTGVPSRYLEISAADLRGSDNGAAGTVLALRDVTTRRRLENELLEKRKHESLGLLAGGIAHDFNNLLGVIQGTLSLVAKIGNSSEEQQELFATALQATRNAAQLTEQLLTFARGDTPEVRTASVSDIVDESVRLAMSGSDVHCEVAADEDIWPVEVDPTQIARVVGNILMNARQAMGERGRIRVSCRNHAPVGEGRQVRITIEDEGPGIPERDLSRIFDPYYTTKEQGNGLGLAIVHAIVDRHGGRLAVKSVPGRGTTVSVYLPSPGARPRADAPTGGHILVLDDEADVRVILTRMLTELGHDCDAVGEGEAAIEAYAGAAAQGRPYGAVILDLTVPGGMGGLEVLERLRGIDEGVRAIVTSGYSDDLVVANFRLHGFAGCLEKPYDMDLLEETLAEVLGRDRT